MKKLKLNLDDLKVNSFQLVNSILNEKGTILGNMEAPKATETAITACETFDITVCQSYTACPACY